MRKILLKLAAAAALLFGLSSCDLDMVDNYNFFLAYETSITDDARLEAVKGYLDAFINLPSQKAQYLNTPYADAVYQGQELFDEILTRVDRDFILDQIQSEEDIIRFVGLISGKNLKEAVAQIYWTWDWKQSQAAPGD